MSLSTLCKQLLVVHHAVRSCQIEALMPGPVDQLRRIRREQGMACRERKRLAALIRQECTLRVNAWDAGRRYSEIESANRFRRRSARGR